MDVRGTLAAVHFRDERGFAIFSLEQTDGSRVRARGYLPPEVTLRAVIRIGGTWTQHPQYDWQVQVRTVELIDHLDQRGVVAFLVAYTTHSGSGQGGASGRAFRRSRLRSYSRAA